MRKTLPFIRKTFAFILCALSLLSFAGCGDVAKLPPAATMGVEPELPPPTRTLIPTVHIAPAKGWPEGRKPVAAAGTTVAAFAINLEHPRWIYVLPNGDVLVAESAAPPKPDNSGGGIKAWFMKKAHGTASRSAATTWSSCLSAAASRRASRWRY